MANFLNISMMNTPRHTKINFQKFPFINQTLSATIKTEPRKKSFRSSKKEEQFFNYNKQLSRRLLL